MKIISPIIKKCILGTIITAMLVGQVSYASSTKLLTKNCDKSNSRSRTITIVNSSNTVIEAEFTSQNSIKQCQLASNKFIIPIGKSSYILNGEATSIMPNIKFHVEQNPVRLPASAIIAATSDLKNTSQLRCLTPSPPATLRGDYTVDLIYKRSDSGSFALSCDIRR